MEKKWYYWICVVVGISLLAFYVGCESDDGTGSGEDSTDALTNSGDDDVEGNGAPNGAHYNLNLIGSKKVKKPDLQNNSGHRIFPPLSGSTKIMLSPGDFQMLDANGTDGPAAFQLPYPDPENDGVPAYTVWARAVATPGGASTTTTCATDAVTNEEYCSAKSLELARNKGKPVFVNASDELLYVYADLNKDGAVERYPLFNEALVNYYWFYDNEGLKVAQLRFYGEDDDDDDDDNNDNDDNNDDDDTDEDDDDDTDEDDDDDDTDSDTDVIVE